jgi:Mg-chelatase subunit ChlD
MLDRPRDLRARGGKVIVLVCALCLVLPTTSARKAEPSVQSKIEEQASSYLSVVRLRIEPTRSATIGQCQALGVEDLSVMIQGETLSGGEMLNLDRKRPPTLHALVIDNSASMVADLDYATFAAKEYVKQLRPDREKGLIMTFDENVVLMQAPTHDRQQLLDTIDLVRAGSRTSMLDALYYSMQELDSHRERPVLILLTDGADTSSLHGVEDIERQVLDRTDLTVFTIGLGLKTDQGVKPTRELLRDLADSTHGRYFEVTEGESLRKVFSQIRDILENEAILTVADPDSRERRHRIRVPRADCTTLSRPSPGLRCGPSHGSFQRSHARRRELDRPGV